MSFPFLERMETLLRRIEWIQCGVERMCPGCRGTKTLGHREGCEIVARLEEIYGITGGPSPRPEEPLDEEPETPNAALVSFTRNTHRPRQGRTYVG